MHALHTCGLLHSDTLGYNVCLPLPEAFRSLPRPSSAPDAKASSLRSYQLKRYFAELCLVLKDFLSILRRSLKLYLPISFEVLPS